MTTSPRRIGSESAESRAALLDATERLMLEHGYAAVSSRRVATEAGRKHQLVHYYFRSMDDLFVAAFRRRAEVGLVRQAEAMATERPLHALWEQSNDPRGTALLEEFVALGNHRPPIRTEIASFAERYRTAHLGIVEEVLSRRGIEDVSPVIVLVVITALSRMLVIEDGLGLTTGHEETRALVERVLDELEP